MSNKANDDLIFFRDDTGAARAEGKDERLAVFLETDLQGSLEVCNELLLLLANTQARSEFSGNAHHVTIAEQTVLIESNADPDAPDRRLKRTDFQRAVSAWQTFIATKN